MKKIRCNKNTMMGALVVVLGLCIVYLVYTHKTSIIEGVDSETDACQKAQDKCNACVAKATPAMGVLGGGAAVRDAAMEKCDPACNAAAKECGW